MTESTEYVLTVVGIGEDGWAGLSPAAAAVLAGADVVLGNRRQVELVREHVRATETWPSPMSAALAGLRERYAGRSLAVLASGDPMLYGLGATLVRQLGADAVRVLPQPSSVSLACARLGWPVTDVDVVSLVGRPDAGLHRWLYPGRRLLVLVSEPDGAARIAAALRTRGWAASRLTVLERLGGPAERHREGTAASWPGWPGTEPAGMHDRLAIVAVRLVPDPGTTPWPLTPGLPDEAYDGDGVLTKREVRAITLAALNPLPGQLLWDIGAGSGSVAIEWLRTHPAMRAVAVEPREDRRGYTASNAAALGVPELEVIAGIAPAALADLPTPDAVFVGGGLTADGTVEACLAALPSGGRLVANAVTVEAEAALAGWHRRLGGSLTRIAVARASALGGFTAYRPALPVTQWAYIQGES